MKKEKQYELRVGGFMKNLFDNLMPIVGFAIFLVSAILMQPESSAGIIISVVACFLMGIAFAWNIAVTKVEYHIKEGHFEKDGKTYAIVPVPEDGSTIKIKRKQNGQKEV